MKQRILLKGPFLSLSGYGYQARFALEAIRTREDLFDIYIINTGWGQTSWLTEDTPVKKYIEEKIVKTIQYIQSGGKFDINLQVTIPNEVEQNAPINVLYTAGIETTRVAPQWLEKVNLVDKVIVVSNHSKQVFENTQYDIHDQNGKKQGLLECETPVDAVNYCIKDHEKKSLDIDLDYDFNFLTMAQWGPRKDLENVVFSFLNEFWEEEVGLVIKTSIKNNSLIDRINVEDRLESILQKAFETKDEDKKKCKFYLLHGAMTNEELMGLYHNKDIKAFVTSTHGEGFGLSLFESAYNNLPVIAPAWSGHCDFLYRGKDPLCRELKYTLNRVNKEAVWEGVIQEDSMWCYVKPEELMKQMREVYDNIEEYEEKAQELKEYLEEEFTPKKKYKEFVNSVIDVIPSSEISNDEIDQWLNDMDIDIVETD